MLFDQLFGDEGFEIHKKQKITIIKLMNENESIGFFGNFFNSNSIRK